MRTYSSRFNLKTIVGLYATSSIVILLLAVLSSPYWLLVLLLQMTLQVLQIEHLLANTNGHDEPIVTPLIRKIQDFFFSPLEIEQKKLKRRLAEIQKKKVLETSRLHELEAKHTLYLQDIGVNADQADLIQSILKKNTDGYQSLHRELTSRKQALEDLEHDVIKKHRNNQKYRIALRYSKTLENNCWHLDGRTDELIDLIHSEIT